MNIVAVTSLFNVSARRYTNFLKFVGRMRELEIPVIVLSDLALISIKPDEMLRHYKVSNPHGLWQKEALINAAMDLLPDDCTHVLAIDADIMLDKVWHTKPAFEVYADSDYCQPWDRIDHLDDKGEVSLSRYSLQAVSIRLGTEAVAKQYKAFIGPSPGACWMYSRDWLSSNPLYSVLPLGGGDAANHWPLYGLADIFPHRYLSLGVKCLDHYLKWVDNIEYGKPSRIPPQGTIQHLFHGPLEARQYHKRHGMLEGFDPLTDVEIHNGVLRFTASGLEKKFDEVARAYFKSRKD